MTSYDREVRISDAYGRQRQYGENTEEEEKKERWRKMTKLSANYARSARFASLITYSIIHF